MATFEWNEFMVTGVLALCVLGPVCVFVLTQKLFDSPDDVASKHFDFEAFAGPPGEGAAPATAAGVQAPARRCERQACAIQRKNTGHCAESENSLSRGCGAFEPRHVETDFLQFRGQ
jgi:hypothetical protein